MSNTSNAMPEKKTPLGWIGMMIFAVMHALLSLGVVSPGIFYQLWQITGACCLGYSAYRNGFLPSAALELYWFIVSIIAIVRLLVLT